MVQLPVQNFQISLCRLALAVVFCLASAQVSSQPLPPLKMALGENKPPYLIVNSRSGVEYELLEHIVREMGYRLEADFVPANRAIYLFENHQTDAIASVRTVPSGRGCATNSYITYRNVAISLSASHLSIQKPDDLSRFRVAAFQTARLNLGAAYAEAVAKSPYYIEVSPQIIANRLLYKNRVDVVVADPLIFRYLNSIDDPQNNRLPPISMHPIFPPSNYVAVFQTEAMCRQFNLALKIVHASNLMSQLIDKYLLPGDRTAKTALVPE